MRTGGQQGVPAEFEEIVIEADLRTPSTSAKIAQSISSCGDARAPGMPSRGVTPGRAAPCGPASRSPSAAARPAPPPPTAPCTPAARPPATAAPRGIRRRHRAGHHVADQPLIPGVSSRTTTAACPTDGCAASAASTSPSSTRNPRTFTWSSVRPRYSSSPPAFHRTRSPGPVHPLAGARTDRATNRSAVRPGRPRYPRASLHPGHVQLTRHPRPAPGASALVQHVHLRVPRSAGQSALTPAPPRMHARAVTSRRLRRPVQVGQPHAGSTAQPSPELRGQRLTAADHRRSPVHAAAAAPARTPPASTARMHDRDPLSLISPASVPRILMTTWPRDHQHRALHQRPEELPHRDVEPERRRDCSTPVPRHRSPNRSASTPAGSPRPACVTTTPLGRPVEPDV